MNSRTRNARNGTAFAGTLLLALTPAAPALAKAHHHKLAKLSGVVVHENRSAHTFVVAERSGRLDAIHGHRLPVGDKVVVKARKLANGTYAAKKEKVLSKRRARRVELEGVVTAENASANEAVVSGSGSSIPVDTSGAAGDANPPVGEAVDVSAEVETDGEVKVDEMTDVGQSDAFRVEGKILAIDDQARTLTISADDDEETGQSIVVTLPASFDMSAYSVGDCVELTVSKAADGSLTAIQSFGDGNEGDANDGGDGHDRGGPGGDRSDGHQDGDQSDSSDNSGSGDGQSGATSTSGSSDGSSGSGDSGGSSGSDVSGSDSSSSSGSDGSGH